MSDKELLADERGISDGQARLDAALRKILSYSLPSDNRFTCWSDKELIVAYYRTTGETGDAEADALCAEIRRRGFDV